MRKSLGAKRKTMSDDQIAEITRLYAEFAEGDRCKIFRNEDFGYRRITVERPLRVRWEVSDDTLATLRATKAVEKLDEDARERLLSAVEGLKGISTTEREVFLGKVRAALADVGRAGKLIERAMLEAATIRDAEAVAVKGKNGTSEADPELRDYENVPLSEDIVGYMQREVLPAVSDAWFNEAKTKVGWEIPFTRCFYRFPGARSRTELDAAVQEVESRIGELATRTWPSINPVELGWEEARAKTLFRERNTRGQVASLGSVLSDGTVVLRAESEMSVWNPAGDTLQYKLVEPGDFVIGLRSFQHGISLGHVRVLVSPAYTVLIPLDPELSPFFAHYFRSKDFIARLNAVSSGIMQGKTINFESFSSLNLPVPPVEVLKSHLPEIEMRRRWLDDLQDRVRELADLVDAQRDALIAEPGAANRSIVR